MNIAPYGMNIKPESLLNIRPTTEKPAASEASDAGEKPSLTFADVLRQAISTDTTAQKAVDSYAMGTNQNLHETMISLEKADISLSLLVGVRNKLLDAYREIMRMS